MQLTNRDHHMLQWINGHGFVTVEQVRAWMRVTYAAAQVRVRKLVDAGLLERKRLEFAKPRLHWLTKTGWELSGDELAPPKRINWSATKKVGR